MSIYYKIKKPDLSVVNKEKLLSKFISDNNSECLLFIESTFSPYITWDKLKYIEPIPPNYTREELWFLIKFFRKTRLIASPIKSEDGSNFSWIKLPKFEQFFHEIDMNTGGELFVSKSDVDKKKKQMLISRGIMEEAIASSQLEGASTSRKFAKKFLKEGRKARNESEHMILNNYLTMQLVEDEYKNKEMSLSMLLELHKSITKNILTEDGEEPRLRNKKDEIFVTDRVEGIIYHKAPNINFVKKELKVFIDFANDEGSNTFIHPLIKAIMLHFWMGYLHPFTDGNGRVARLLFYWYLLKKDYWAFSYLPISKIIKKSPIQYSMAYLHSEQDDYDLSYFIDYHVKKIEQSVEAFKDYLATQAKKNALMSREVRVDYGLNDRQIKVLHFLHGSQSEYTNIKIHMNVFQVSNKTAIRDLKALLSLGFLEKSKKGKTINYFISEKGLKLLD